jgi:RNA polymerase sigma factor (sigma-70 family)
VPLRPGRGVHGSSLHQALRDLLIRELHRLPPRQRAVLVLRYWEDLSELQIATLLGCSAGTVKSQASKALARLRNAGFVSAGVSNEH